ncbi:methylpurine-DNA glycosylase (MPG) [Denitrovibrio acetiphilus DSM 12809]|uniref:Putative 3-methyladenine DNA glycosylase n=1 Tax=Denitrovibrio acetiphilus (strain DSM 12809 / NBRC 114555 / N2460) TaxID=522772 RepID=D4H4D1_DENA2|nr:DNA-3-methyladenine glycosylase [Denitrovibrio acetiphilus]ADD69260.1 methylpurine-DNA glycosylase (MPG) [Denitrovibrio acetiphilus DSM 12809]
MLNNTFFQKDAKELAADLLGKVIRKKHGDIFLSAMIIETECYYLTEKGSHASLGYTEKRKALFMEGGTIYMYYSRGKDSLNVSCQGEGNAVLIKGAVPYVDSQSPSETIDVMQKLNPMPDGREREVKRLCAGQTLLCRSLGLKLTEWNGRNFMPGIFYFEDVGYSPEKIIQTTRLGIPAGRDEHLPYRFVDFTHAESCTSNPLTKKNNNYTIINNETV